MTAPEKSVVYRLSSTFPLNETSPNRFLVSELVDSSRKTFWSRIWVREIAQILNYLAGLVEGEEKTRSCLPALGPEAIQSL